MTGTEIYKRTSTYETDVPTIRLHAPQWKLLLTFDGQRSLAEVALSADLSFAEALPLTERFLQRQWIEEQPISLDQYLKRAGAADISTLGSSVPPTIVLHEPRSQPPPIEPAAAMEIIPPVASIPGARGPMRLSAVVDYIVSIAGNVSLGQLLVYRVFLRVPPELIQAENVSSIHLVDDPGVVRTPSLQQAITEAVADIVQRPLPETIYSMA